MLPRPARSKPVASCRDCGQQWFGETSAEALRKVGACIKCGGTVEYAEESPATGAGDARDSQALPAHLALGTPRPAGA